MSRMRNRAMASRAMVGVILAAAGSAWAQDAHELAFTLTGEDGAFFGWSIDLIGDVNGDGSADILVGSPSDDTNGDLTGSARVFSGADGTELLAVFGEIGPFDIADQLGTSVAGLGDVSGDGVPDFIAGAPSRVLNNLRAGGADVFSGADGEKLYSVQGDAAVNFESFGQAVSGIGDVNGDGVPDFVVGAQSTDGNPGFARVFSGVDGTTLFTVDAGDQGNRFGSAVSGAGDVDGDGVPDFIVGDKSDAGRARVFSGVDGALLLTLGSMSVSETDDAVDGIGDVNGDGLSDVVVGLQGGIFDPTSVAVYSGADGSALFTFEGELIDGTSDGLGRTVAGAGDLDGDSVPDVLVGIPRIDRVNNAGAVRAYSGADGSELFTVAGNPDDSIGFALGAEGDLNGDAIPDFIASGRSADTVLAFVSASGDDCPADLTGPGGDGVPDGTLTSDDFFFYLGLFADGDPQADLTGPGGDGEPDGSLTSDDFFFYLGLFAQGCP